MKSHQSFTVAADEKIFGVVQDGVAGLGDVKCLLNRRVVVNLQWVNHTVLILKYKMSTYTAIRTCSSPELFHICDAKYNSYII